VLTRTVKSTLSICAHVLCHDGACECLLADAVWCGAYCERVSTLHWHCAQNMGKTSLVDEKLNKVDALKPIAEDLGCTLAQLSLAWCGESRTAQQQVFALINTQPPNIHVLADRRCDTQRLWPTRVRLD